MADRSVFDGYSPTLYRSDGSIVGSWPAISGRSGNQRPSDQNLPFKGPLTEGRYSFSTCDIQPLTTLDAVVGLVPHHGRFPGSMAAWGTERAALAPDLTPTNGRSNFFIHGGFTPGSAGCIDLGSNEKVYFDALRSTGEPSHEVVVRRRRRDRYSAFRTCKRRPHGTQGMVLRGQAEMWRFNSQWIGQSERAAPDQLPIRT